LGYAKARGISTPEVNVDNREELNNPRLVDGGCLVDGFEKRPLRRFTPCLFATQSEVVRALAVVHTELVLIHPFREGNGRLARILAIVMAVQYGLPPLDFGHLKGRKKQEYFRAVRAGMHYDYGPMEEIFTGVIERTLKRRSQP